MQTLLQRYRAHNRQRASTSHTYMDLSSLHEANMRRDATGFQATAFTTSSCPRSTSTGLGELDCQT